MKDQELMFDAAARLVPAEHYERWVETHTRPTHPDTSMEAAQKIAPKVGSRTMFALNMLQRRPDSTAAELEEYAKCRGGTVRKRLSDLKAMGRAKVTGKRKCRITGMTAMTWEAVDRAE